MDYELAWIVETPHRDSKGDAFGVKTLHVHLESITALRKIIMNSKQYKFPLNGSTTSARVLKADGSKTEVGAMTFRKGQWEWVAFPSFVFSVVKKDGSLGARV